MAGKVNARPISRPSKNKAVSLTLVALKISKPNPVSSPIFDQLGHWPEFRPDNSKCHSCKTSIGRINSEKCNLYLCLTLNFMMSKNGHTYFKKLTVFTLQDF